MKKWASTGVVCALSMMFAGATASAALKSFVIDPAQSSITVGGTVGAGVPIVGQGPGSLTTTYGGTIVVDLDSFLAPTTIGFDSANAVANDSGSWAPNDVDTTLLTPTALANYGLFADLSPFPALNAALRDFRLDISTAAALSVTAGAFDSTQDLTIKQGLLQFNAGVLGNGTSDLGDEDPLLTAPNGSATDGTYSVAGDIATLTVPIDISIAITGNIPATITLSGQLVATAIVPEPASISVALIAIVGLAFAVARRRG